MTMWMTIKQLICMNITQDPILYIIYSKLITIIIYYLFLSYSTFPNQLKKVLSQIGKYLSQAIHIISTRRNDVIIQVNR